METMTNNLSATLSGARDYGICKEMGIARADDRLSNGRLWWLMEEADYCPETGGFEGTRESNQVCVVQEWQNHDGETVEDYTIVARVDEPTHARAVAALPDLLEANADAWCILQEITEHMGDGKHKSRDALIRKWAEISTLLNRAKGMLDDAARLAGYDPTPSA